MLPREHSQNPTHTSQNASISVHPFPLRAQSDSFVIAIFAILESTLDYQWRPDPGKSALRAGRAGQWDPFYDDLRAQVSAPQPD